jgi:hypothetical protein
MSDSAKSAAAVDLKELESLLARLPQDTAGSVIDQLRLKVAANEAETVRRSIINGVAKVLELVSEELTKVLPPGKVLTVTHVPASKDDKGGDVPARLGFDIDMGGGLRSLGSTKGSGASKSGKIARMTLDGVTVDAPAWRAMLDEVNTRLKAKGLEGIKVPQSSFNARELLIRSCSKFPGLVYVGDVDPAPAPAAEAPKK